MEGKHTQGKWQQSHRITDDEGNYSTEVYTDDTVICTLDWAGHKQKDGKTTTSRREANAKLIASAPELLASCIFLIESLGDLSSLTGMQSQAHHKARLAIEKATE